MPDPKNSPLTRREFATRAVLLGAGATFAAVPLPAQSQAPSPAPQTATSASPEADLRFQTIVALYGDRFSESQKADLHRVCATTQALIDRLRAYKVENADEPALHLKPLIEREKTPATAAKTPQRESAPPKH